MLRSFLNWCASSLKGHIAFSLASVAVPLLLLGLAVNIRAGYPVLAVAMTALVAAAASENGVLAKVRVPGAAWFAAASYSLYLSHKMVYRELYERFTPSIGGHGIWTALIYIAAILAVGAVLHYTVERPFLQLREPVRRWWARRRPQQAMESVA